MRNKYLLFVFHLFNLTIYIVILKGLADFSNMMSKTMTDNFNKEHRRINILDNFRMYFFTTWNYILQIIFAAIAVVDESSKFINLPLSLQKYLGPTRTYLFNTFVFPCSLLVMTVFWGLWSIDRELIFPEAIDKYFPSYLNHGLHTFIIVPVIVESFVPKKHHFVEFKNMVWVLFAFMTVYQILFISAYYTDNVWLYPIYDYMSWPLRLIYSVGQLVVVLIYQKAGLILQFGREANGGKVRQKIN
ncbi:hypothetical protein NQ317_005005 [Molorchus minor]|uniref:Androgen-dependent TFPI-regulating protein n=1 Tax=Molorchus minor TaxID=1323400 RepID=A0ABQ9K5E1_9CUCU|nr:hypothetical protein NQ317_005005 [Molorchus minor]